MYVLVIRRDHNIIKRYVLDEIRHQSDQSDFALVAATHGYTSRGSHERMDAA
jgi:hypothetical protein